MKCPHCGEACSRAARHCPHCGVVFSPETRANRMRGRDLIGGHFYPLDLALALSLDHGLAYITQAADRASSSGHSSRTRVQRLANGKLAHERQQRARAP